MKDFKNFLLHQNLSKNTIDAYETAVEMYNRDFDEITKQNLLAFKAVLVDKYKGKTVNLRIQGINKYLEFIGKDKLKLKYIKVQQKSYLENVISDADYEFFKNKLIKDGNLEWYFVARFLGATGARVSELIQFKYEHLKRGYIDLYTKSGKIRRIFIPKRLRIKAIEYYDSIGRIEGYLFLNKNGKQITTRGIAHQLKALGEKLKMNLKVIYPHSFRHRFAKNFLEKRKDIALLADLMGHESIETTRIYLRKTSEEQQAIVDKIIDW
ncbi:tyrosine-type recombinase/integrase [Mycoplasmopsis arginini]|uniref:Tyrosine-type recombinase/integrase n=1 Tax=Mycoplasmopsis arginini TaxID=2094 RepID=A0A449BLS3_MYCAR|nr:tyrosine-type recombinase/integrase [Mycoplasmopsis arginini]MDI3349669.1 tyrosine-type recombinase/integrase [Mycoplasmopsis arginini]WVN22188.1 tyrosine-type recombinase/integrase [Mycoplasmopsis arginini]VEU81595.1 Tyrosine recombinase XerC [Mycoplasmopsis arginini]VEU83381.1 Tyrosine recombinase XerC [Mycoplasmopsis arginini]VEU83399.1 Tyrosine recombinase XerC [Mycoplasmopsis arginini]